jgi:hypothetical protein
VYAADVRLGVTVPASSSRYILKVASASVLLNMERKEDLSPACAKWAAENPQQCADHVFHLHCSESCELHGYEFATVTAFLGRQTFRVLQVSDTERSCLIATTHGVDDIFYFRLLLKMYMRGTLVSSHYVFGGLRANESQSALWEEYGGRRVRRLSVDTSADCRMTLTPSMSVSTGEAFSLCPIEFEYSVSSRLAFVWGTLAAANATPFIMLTVREATAPGLDVTVSLTAPLSQLDAPLGISLSHAYRCRTGLIRLFLAFALHQSVH